MSCFVMATARVYHLTWKCWNQHKLLQETVNLVNSANIHDSVVRKQHCRVYLGHTPFSKE